VKVSCDEGVAIHIGPESCADGREAVREALTGEHAGQALSLEKCNYPGADALNSCGRQHRRERQCERPSGLAWSETLACMEAPCTGTGRPRDWPERYIQVLQTPTHNAVDRRDRPRFDKATKRKALIVIEFGSLPRSLAVKQTRWPFRIEAHDPVPHDLQRHATNFRCLPARGAVINFRKRQKTSRLGRILRCPDRVPGGGVSRG